MGESTWPWIEHTQVWSVRRWCLKCTRVGQEVRYARTPWKEWLSSGVQRVNEDERSGFPKSLPVLRSALLQVAWVLWCFNTWLANLRVYSQSLSLMDRFDRFDLALFLPEPKLECPWFHWKWSSTSKFVGRSSDIQLVWFAIIPYSCMFVSMGNRRRNSL